MIITCSCDTTLYYLNYQQFINLTSNLNLNSCNYFRGFVARNEIYEAGKKVTVKVRDDIFEAVIEYRSQQVLPSIADICDD